MADDKLDLEEIDQKLAALPWNEQMHAIQSLLAGMVERTAAMPASALPGGEVGEATPIPRQPTKLVEHHLGALTYSIIGCAMAVHGQLGYSLREVNYQRALELALERAHLAYQPQQQITVFDGPDSRRVLGYYIPDLVVENSVVVELKALGCLDNSHVAQVISYLAVTGCDVGLLINFGQRRLRWRRILPPVDLQAYRINTHWLWNPREKHPTEQPK